MTGVHGRDSGETDDAGMGGGQVPARVLIVDDSRDDAELAVIALRDAGVAVDTTRVDGANALRSALDAFDPDLVLSDVNIPGFSGPEALEIVRDTRPGLPFVFMSGSIYGMEPPPPADGLVLKDDLGALPDLVRRLLGR